MSHFLPFDDVVDDDMERGAALRSDPLRECTTDVCKGAATPISGSG